MPTPLDPVELRRQAQEARSDFSLGRPAQAAGRYRDLLRRIERSGDERDEVLASQAHALLGLAIAQFETSGRLRASMTLLDGAEAVAQRSAASAMVAAIRGQRGLLLLRSGERRQALRAFDAAAEVRGTAEVYDQISILLNRGVLHLDVGSLDQAVRDFEECVSIAERSDDTTLLWKARHNLAFADFLAGRVPRALAAMEEVERKIERDLRPILLLDRARVLREVGLVGEADTLLARAADDLHAAGLHQDVGETGLVRAECALVERDAVRARRLARSAEQLFARRGNTLWQRRAQLLVLRCERSTLEQRPAAARRTALRRLAARARGLAETCRAERRYDLAAPADLLATECELRARGLSPSRARDRLPAPPRVRATDPLETRLHTRVIRALVAAQDGEPARAAAEVRRGLGELGSYQSGFGSLDLRTASAVHGLPLARLGLDLAVRTGSPAQMFAAVERSRALSTRLAPVSPPGDERTAELLTDLRRTEEQARGLAGEPAAGERLASLRARVATLRGEVRARAWELEGGTEDPGAAGVGARLSQVRRAAVAEGTAFVTFVVHESRMQAVLATGRAPRVLDLGPAVEVLELVQRVRADLDALALPHVPLPLAQAVRGSAAAGLARLDALLLAPLRVDGTPLVVSCSPALAVLPWTSLPSRHRTPVVVSPSAATWLRGSGASRRTQPLVVSVAGPGLHRAELEAGAVQATWPGARLLVGTEASTSAVARSLREADLVHVAAHGSHQQQSPLFSSLRLADGPLYAYELDADGPAAPCVVLSACEAGVSTLRPGGEGLGLTNVLLHLGARSVLAGVARLADDVAARVMARVHTSMAAGVGSAQALSDAVAEEEDPAPFVTFGSTW